MVEDMNEIMSSDLHHLVFGGEEGAEVEALFPLNENAGGTGAGEGGNQGEGGVGSRFKNFSYRPSAGFVLRADGRLPVLSKDKVLIRVDATTITTRDCLERLRRDSIKELKDEAWVPGHEIVGHVVCAGANAKFLSDKRVAAVLPHGGGCSQYMCIDAKYVIALPQEAGSTNDVIALLSSYVTARQCLESFVGTEPEEDEDVESNVESKEAVDAGQEQEKSRLFGKNVLIVGAGSPIGRALVDLATNAGATVYNESHLSHLSTMLWGSQMDLVVDTIGNPDNNPSFYKVMKARARLVRVNITSCGKRYEPLVETTLFGVVISSRSPLAEKDKSYYGRVINDKAINYDVFHSFNEDKESFTEDLVYLLDLLKKGKIRPNKISRTGFANLEGDWEKVMTGKGKNGGIVLVSPWSQKRAQFENASYSPSTGFILRADAMLPELLEDEVLIRVDATTITTRDCLERLRRDRTEELKEEDWVPGHEIVGHVVRAGANAKFLSDKRVAAVLPHGGGCSQYMCIDAKDVVALPEEVGSTKDMIALLSTYMTAHQCLKSVAAIEPEESPHSTLAACGAWLQPLSRTETEKEMIEDDAGQEQERSRLFGKKVLIVGAGSSVGLALVDLARNAGATVHTVSHRSHLDAIREMGAHYWYPFYQKNLWESKWGGEMDLIVDTIGDPNNNPSFYKVMKTRARLVRVNITSCEKKYVQHAETTQVGFGIFDSSYYIKDKVIDYDIFNSFNEDKESFTEDLAYLLGLTKTGKIRPKFFSQVGFGKLGGEWEKLMAGTSGVVLVLP
jgi:NADPH:quinone reductase-like Zn-dependent oxidoreductase